MPFNWVDNQDSEEFNGLNIGKLERDEAFVIVDNQNSVNNTYLYGVYRDCYKCPYTKEEISLDDKSTVVVNTLHQKLWRILLLNQKYSPQDSKDNVLCDLDPQLGQFGVYRLEVTNASCQVQTLKEPVNIYTPIITVILLYFLLYLIAYSVTKVYQVWFKTPRKQEKSKQQSRVQSIDTFRGISIVVMIFANYGCGGYEILEHAIWNGLHLADLVFPWFIWIMGFCIPLSIKSAMSKGISKKDLIKNITRRSCVLFCLGIILQSPINLSTVRVMGVLQRFGVCYFVVATAFTLLISSDNNDSKRKLITIAKDILLMRNIWIVGILSLTANLLLTFLLSAPGCPKGYLGPGGLHENAEFLNCTGGASGYIDRLILSDHMYQKAGVKKIYHASQNVEPEGLLGCLTSILHVVIGAQAGVTLQTFKDHTKRLKRWFLWGVILALLGGGLCEFSKENGLVPINKQLWSASFVFVTCSSSFFLLCVLYFLIDVRKIWNGKPFSFCGMNAILLYVGHNLTYTIFPIRWIPPGGLNTYFITLTETVWGVSMWILIAFYCYKVTYFLTV